MDDARDAVGDADRRRRASEGGERGDQDPAGVGEDVAPASRRAVRHPGHRQGPAGQADRAIAVPAAHKRSSAEDADRQPDLTSSLGRGEKMAEPRPKPQPAEQHQGGQDRKVGGGRVAEQPGIAGGREQERGDVMAEDDAGQRREQDPLDDEHAARRGRRARSEGAVDPAAEASRNEERPALEIEPADREPYQGRGEHDPRPGASGRVLEDAADEERGKRQLGQRQRGGA